MRDIGERLLEFAVACLKLTGKLGRTAAGRYVAGQLMRSSASAGANYSEACGAESRADFAHKLQLVLKELREADELARIIAKSVLTVKSKSQ